MATQSNTVGRGENLKNSKPERSNTSSNKSGAAKPANFATSSSFTRRAMGQRTLQGKERSKFNARKHGLFSKAVLLQDESRAEYDALLNGLMENLQPQGKLEIVLVENLATLWWRKRRLLQVETVEIEKVQFLIWDLVLQNKIDELEYAQLKDASDAKLGHSNRLLLIRNAIEILDINRLGFMAAESQAQATDAIRQTLKSIYGYKDEGPAPYAMGQMSLMISKLISSAERGKEDSEDPPDVKQIMVEAISKEIMRLAKLHDTAAEVEELRRDHNLAGARVPSQEVSDRLIRYEAHLSREFDRTLAQLERLKRIRLGQPVLPKLEVHHSRS
jgi:hypothetical protein